MKHIYSIIVSVHSNSSKVKKKVFGIIKRCFINMHGIRIQRLVWMNWEFLIGCEHISYRIEAVVLQMRFIKKQDIGLTLQPNTELYPHVSGAQESHRWPMTLAGQPHWPVKGSQRPPDCSHSQAVGQENRNYLYLFKEYMFI